MPGSTKKCAVRSSTLLQADSTRRPLPHRCRQPCPCSTRRFVPDTEATALAKQRAGVAEDSYAEWLRATTNLTVDTEVNIQLGEFTLKKHRVEPVDDRFRGFTDFAVVFGKNMANANGGIQCAEVKNTTNRLWVRLVGYRHDLFLWKPESRVVEKPFTRMYPSGLASSEKWILDAVKPLFSVCRCPPETFEVYLPRETLNDYASLARLCVVVKASSEKGHQPKSRDGKIIRGRSAAPTAGRRLFERNYCRPVSSPSRSCI